MSAKFFLLGLAFSSLSAFAADPAALISCRQEQAKDAFQFTVRPGAHAGQVDLLLGTYDRDNGEFLPAAVLPAKEYFTEVAGQAHPLHYTYLFTGPNKQPQTIRVLLAKDRLSGKAQAEWQKDSVVLCWQGDANDSKVGKP